MLGLAISDAFISMSSSIQELALSSF